MKGTSSKWWLVIVGIVIMTGLFFALHGDRVSPNNAPGEGRITGETVKSTSPRTSVEFGRMQVGANGIVEFKLKPGQNYAVRSTEKVGYTWYMDGVKLHHIPAVIPAGHPMVLTNVSPMGGQMGYRLDPEYRSKKVWFVYCKYYGDEPPEKWFDLAMQHIASSM